MPRRETAASTAQSVPSNSDETEEQAYLKALGLRVRARREQVGLTRKQLASKAGVSERYLAQLELGSGNASMLLLRKLAHALSCSMHELIDRTFERVPATSPLAQELIGRLRQLDDRQLAEVSELLRQRFGEAGVARLSRIALIGLRGAGKSTIGTRLAKKLGFRFVELDHEIEREMGSDLAGIFAVYGQDAYREAESRVLARLIEQEERIVLATGGSIVTTDSTYAQVRSHCYTVWLRAEPEDHMNRVVEQGDMRPMRGREHAMSELRHILASRQPLYQLADQTINTSAASLEACVDEICRLLNRSSA